MIEDVDEEEGGDSVASRPPSTVKNFRWELGDVYVCMHTYMHTCGCIKHVCA